MKMDSLNPSDSGTQQPPNQGMPLQDDIQQALNPDEMGMSESDPNMARDPVCGKLVDKRTATNTLAPPVNMAMETLYFDSPECKAIFEEDPQKYGYNF